MRYLVDGIWVDCSWYSHFRCVYEKTLNMENCQVRLSTITQLLPECLSDTKSRFCPMGNQTLPREVVCPMPRRTTSVPFMMESFNQSWRPKGISSRILADCGLDILDLLHNKDDNNLDFEPSEQAAFFCGSPPVRSVNPVVHDEHFAKQRLTIHNQHSSGSADLEAKPPISRSERGSSPSCTSSRSSFGGIPMVRIEGFVCGSPPALA